MTRSRPESGSESEAGSDPVLSARVRVLEAAEHLHRAEAILDDADDDIAALVEALVRDAEAVDELLAATRGDAADRWRGDDAA